MDAVVLRVFQRMSFSGARLGLRKDAAGSDAGVLRAVIPADILTTVARIPPTAAPLDPAS